jgi:hypothetical protein
VECSRLITRKAILLVPLLLIAAASILPVEIPRVHASTITGEACLSDPTTTSLSAPCPPSPAVFAGPVGYQIKVGVYISGSNGTNVFDVTLHENYAYLKAVGVDYSSTVLGTTGTPTVALECLDGRLIAGPVCSATDTPGTIHLAMAAAPGTLTTTPTTGLLFIAIYNITGIAPTGGVSIGFQSGCAQTSVPDGTCVTLAAGSTAIPETVQTGVVFSNSASSSMEVVRLSTNATSSFGPEFPGVANHANITASALNGYMINSTNSVSFTTVTSSQSLSASLTSTVCSSGGAGCSVVLTLTTSTAGNYSVTVFGSFPTVDSAGNPDTLSQSVTVGVSVFDFGFLISPISVTFISGEIATSTATLTSLNGFAGTVTLSTSIVAPATGLTISYSPSQIVLTAGAKVNSTITFRSNAPATTYHARVLAATAGRSHLAPASPQSLAVTVTAPVPDFYFITSPSSIGPQEAGASGASTVTVTYVNGFNSPVTLSESSSPGSAASLNQTILTGTHNVTLTASSQVAGNYVITVSGTNNTSTSGATVSHITTVSLSVFDFNITLSPNQITLSKGTSQTASISIAGFNRFGGTVSLTATAPAGLSASFKPSTVTGTGLSTLNVTSSKTIPSGNYTIVITGTSGGLSHSANFNVTIPVADFRLVVPTPPPTIAGQQTSSIITIIPDNGFGATVVLTKSVTSSNGLTCTLSANSVTNSTDSNLQCSAPDPGNSMVTVTGTSGRLVHTVSIEVVTTSFNFTTSNNLLSMNENSTLTVSFSVGSENGFDGNVSFVAKAKAIPPSTLIGSVPSLSVSPNPVHVRAGQIVMVTLTITIDTSVKPEIFGAYVNATFGAVTKSATPSVTVLGPGIGISSSPTTIVTGAGSAGHSVITLTSENGVTGVVTLSITNPSGATCTLSSQSVTLTKSSPQATTTMTCTGSVGSHLITINAAGTDPDGLPFTAAPPGTATFLVADFVIQSTPTGILINTGQTGHARISITWQNSYSGTVTFSLVPQSGLTASVENQQSLTGSGDVTIDVSSNTAGVYSLVVNATSGSGSHTVTLTVTVTAVQQAPNILGIDPTTFYALVGVLVVVAVGGIVVVLRRKPSRK